DRDRFLVAECRQRPKVPLRLRASAGVSDVLPVLRPTRRRLDLVRMEEELFLSGSARGLLVQIEWAAPVGTEDDRRAVRRPDRARVVPRAEGEPRIDAAGEVPDPDVDLGGARVRHVEGEAIARRGKRGIRIVARVSQRVELLSRPIPPEKASA